MKRRMKSERRRPRFASAHAHRSLVADEARRRFTQAGQPHIFPQGSRNSMSNSSSATIRSMRRERPRYMTVLIFWREDISSCMGDVARMSARANLHRVLSSVRNPTGRRGARDTRA